MSSEVFASRVVSEGHDQQRLQMGPTAIETERWVVIATGQPHNPRDNQGDLSLTLAKGRL
jgi:hypothetical protein